MLTLTNGIIIKCTKDHKLLVYDKDNNKMIEA